ncbi:hypothetical protein GCM10023196_043340 [Actinoallomurus vinaceus]|uniref:Ricin B lectin domain-containing protein n=2 Tax=Actinoallomurus vinaceus TaxID=1080074 RepID=A0ABP8UFP8_9ACTN
MTRGLVPQGPHLRRRAPLRPGWTAAAEALIYTRPGVLEILPALPDQLAKGSINGVRGRNRITVQSLSWDTSARTAIVKLTSDINQDVTFICRRGITSVGTGAAVTTSPLGNHARVVSLTAGTSTTITVGLLTGPFKLVNRNSGKVLDDPGGSPNAGTALDQWSDTNSSNQWWKLVPAATSGYYRLVNIKSGLCADVQSGPPPTAPRSSSGPPTAAPTRNGSP